MDGRGEREQGTNDFNEVYDLETLHFITLTTLTTRFDATEDLIVTLTKPFVNEFHILKKIDNFNSLSFVHVSFLVSNYLKCYLLQTKFFYLLFSSAALHRNNLQSSHATYLQNLRFPQMPKFHLASRNEFQIEMPTERLHFSRFLYQCKWCSYITICNNRRMWSIFRIVSSSLNRRGGNNTVSSRSELLV